MPTAAQSLFPRECRPGDQRANAGSRGYGWQWQQARERFLARNPLCVECQARNELTPATVVDHRIPHRGDEAIFWDVSNWQALCKRCHDRTTAGGE
jgi:5-methylcytosine-specific restriction enzyme A